MISSYLMAAVVACSMILIAALISNLIQFEGGSNPKDPGKRKMWFWIIAILNAIVFFILATFVLAPKADDDQMVHDAYIASVPFATGVGFIMFIILGFILSKIFKKGKLGNWF